MLWSLYGGCIVVLVVVVVVEEEEEEEEEAEEGVWPFTLLNFYFLLFLHGNNQLARWLAGISIYIHPHSCTDVEEKSTRLDTCTYRYR